jgi:hypothetical protein
MGLLPGLGLSGEQVRATILTGVAANYGGELPAEFKALAEALAAAIAEAVEKNNRKVADDLSEQVARFMGGMGRFR